MFQLEYSNEEIRQIVLTNIVKMLTERKKLKSENLQNNIDKIINNHSDDNIYTIDIDNHNNDESERTYVIKLQLQKITAISKQSSTSEFLNKYKDNHKILVVKEISTKIRQSIVSEYGETEVFLEYYLMMNQVEHTFVSRYEILTDPKDIAEYYSKTKKKNSRRIHVTDAMARYYNLKRGDIVRVISPSEVTAVMAEYREVY